MDNESDALAQFLAITGANETSARHMLQATNWQVEEAVNLFFATDHADLDAAAAQGPPPAPVNEPPPEVRAPLPAKMDTLYAPQPLLGGIGAAYGGLAAMKPHHPPQMVAAFRDFQQEAKAASAAGLSVAPGQGPSRGKGAEGGAMAGGSSGGVGVAAPSGLAGLFTPPSDILFPGQLFEDAKTLAHQQDKWLLLNVQTETEFASHLLNRDVWANETVKSTVASAFVFWQVHKEAPEGAKVCSFYHLMDLPAVMILDPFTGRKLEHLQGAFDASRLLDLLVDYLEEPPSRSRKGRKSNARPSSAGPPPPTTAGATQPSRTSSTGAGPPLRRARTEEEELELAIAASLGHPLEAGSSFPEAKAVRQVSATGAGDESRDGGAGGQHLGGASAASPSVDSPYREEGGGGAAGGVDVRGTMAAAAVELGEEPRAGDAGVCTVAIRLPDGARCTRRFLKSQAIRALYKFCVSQVEEAAGGRRFVLAEGYPGAPVLPEDSNLTLEQARVERAIVVMKWDK
eukprot:jgi/Mesvir1/12457/Mv00611-RA.1